MLGNVQKKCLLRTIRITENLVLLVNDIVVKLIFSMHDNFQRLTSTFVHIFKLVMMSWRYVVLNRCLVPSPPYMEDGSLGSLQMVARA